MKTFTGIILREPAASDANAIGYFHTNPVEIVDFDFQTRDNSIEAINRITVTNADPTITFGNIMAELTTLGTSLLNNYDDAGGTLTITSVMELFEITFVTGGKYVNDTIKYDCRYNYKVKIV